MKAGPSAPAGMEVHKSHFGTTYAFFELKIPSKTQHLTGKFPDFPSQNDRKFPGAKNSLAKWD